MNILISNDDGVHAPGIVNLYENLRIISKPTIVALLQERSTTGHSLSLDFPLRVQKIEDSIFGCTGFPADCVLMGLGHLCQESRPDLVVSGINRGANLGQDIYYSGTVAAAREAAFHGVKSIAVSLVLKDHHDFPYYQTAGEFVARIVKDKIHEFLPELCVLNINVPNLPKDQIKGVRFTKLGFKHYAEDIEPRVDSRQRDYYWVTGTYRGFREDLESDCLACHEGYISVGTLFLTDYSDRNVDEIKGYLKNFKL